MITTITVVRFLFVAALFASGIAYTRPVHAAGAGYNGVMAPDTDDAPANTDESEAPLPTVSTPAPTGAVPPSSTASQSTRIPGGGITHDLKTAAHIYGADRNGDGVPDGLKFPKFDYSDSKIRMVDGKTPMEYTVEQDVQHALAPLSNKNLSHEQLAKEAQRSYNALAKLQQGLQAQQHIPEQTYKQMGFSDTYIKTDKAGVDAALGHLDKALEELKPYQ